MRIICICILVASLCACDSINSNRIVFVDSNEFLRNCEVHSNVVRLGFQAAKTNGQYGRLIYSIDYSLRNNISLQLKFVNHEISESIYDVPFDIVSYANTIDTVDTRSNVDPIILVADHCCLYARNIGFGFVYFNFDFSQSNIAAQKRMDVFLSYVSSLHFENMSYADGIAIDNAIAEEFAGTDMSLLTLRNPTAQCKFLLVDRTGLKWGACEDEYYNYFEILRSKMRTFRDGDLILITRHVMGKLPQSVALDQIDLIFIYRQTTRELEDVDYAENYFDCISYNMEE